MKYLHIVFIVFLTSSVAQARKTNFIEAHFLRLSSQQSSIQWLLPFNPVKDPTRLEANVMLSLQKDTYSLYKDIDSKDQNKIEERLQDSFGKPYDVSAKINLGYRFKRFSQFFSTNGGAVLLATDPVFPELQGFLYHDFTSSTAYIFKPYSRLMLKPQISYGARRVLDRKYSLGDLVDKSLDVKFNKAPYIGFLEFNLLWIYSLSEWGQILFQANSLPLIRNEYEYWDTFLGYKTPNLIKNMNWVLSELSLYAGYSPFYGGHYDVSRTYKMGVKTSLSDFLTLDIFTMDNFYPAAILSLRSSYLTVELFSFERAYDDLGYQKSREYGANLKLRW
jgi:hypothetical protein